MIQIPFYLLLFHEMWFKVLSFLGWAARPNSWCPLHMITAHLGASVISLTLLSLVWIQLIITSAFLSHVYLFIFFQPQLLTKSFVNSARMHYSRTHKLHFSVTFSLKMGPTVLFTYLKIILLQSFQFSVSAK